MNSTDACIEFAKALESGDGNVTTKRLRSCQAWVMETPTHYLLQSYATIIASINKQSGLCIDALRVVYGYTATSAGHIAKFRRDYNARECYTLRSGFQK